MRNIAKVVGISKGAAVRAIDALAAEGLVERVTNAADRRSPYIRVTPKGSRLIASARKRLDAVFRRQMDNRR
nr:MarR family transcriptional regulator [Novacetimonas hansenii]